MHEGAYPQLIEELSEYVTQPEGTTKSNAHKFLVGLCHVGSKQTLSLIVKKHIKDNIDNNNHALNIFEYVSTNPHIYDSMDDVTSDRFQNVLATHISSVKSSIRPNSLRHPSRFFRNAFDLLDTSEVIESFEDKLQAYFQRFPFDHKLFFALQYTKSIYHSYRENLYSQIDSLDNDAVDHFINEYAKVDSQIAPNLEGADAFILSLKLLNAAARGVQEAAEIRNGTFVQISATRDKAKSYLNLYRNDAEQYIERHLTTGDTADTLLRVIFAEE